MKQFNTINLPKPVKRFATSTAFRSRRERNDYIRMMVELEYQDSRRSRTRSAPAAPDSDES